MIRSLLRVHRPLAQFYSVKNIYHQHNNEREQIMGYFLNSGRHRMFRKESTIIYQFDDETRNLTTWQCPHSLKNVDWKQSTNDYNNDQMISAFESFLNYSLDNDCPLSDTQFDEFVDIFCARLQEFGLNELIRALQIYARFPWDRLQLKQRNYIDLFHAFDQACTIQSEDLLPDQLLFISSIWMTIPSSKKTWVSALISRLLNRYMKNMSAPEMAQALYYINCMTRPIEDIRAFENLLETTIDDMTLEELSTVLWTFIRLETKIEKQELRDKLFNYLEKKDLSHLPEGQLTKILILTSRIFEPSMSKSTQWLNIAKNLRASLQNRSLKMCILVANVGTPIRLFDHKITWHVFERCLNHPEELRDLSMPDLEYLSRILTMSNHENGELVNRVATMLLHEIINNRLDVVAQRGVFRNFSNIIRNLLMVDVYDIELLDNILSPAYIKFIFKSMRQLDLQIYEIDGYCRINLRDIYKGNLLPTSYVQKLCFLISWVPDKVNRYKKNDEFSYAIEDVVEKLFTHFQYAHAIPHRKHADLIVCLNRNTLEPVDISSNFPPLYKSKIINAASLTNDDPNLMVFSLIASNTKEYLTDKYNKCENIPLGFLAHKITQLKILGFHPIIVPIHLYKEKDPGKAIETFIINKVNEELQANGVNQQLKMTTENQ
ncbi:uncharacterized protein LOC129576975 [Sitodiplosis mosellana]|uniref:uncharacterized protein LOC129576975 n=1 Tax=Sitodiplosis mosellana TaxID=263140 RepID=UPI002443EA02|nr:uncharacterized protein LOC129576975 [Sitodiplosis mosellana]